MPVPVHTYILFFFVCMIASIVGAISGIGGGIIIKPVLEAVSSMDARTISFLSGCTVLSMAVASLIRQRKQAVSFEFKRGTCLALGSAVGGVAGKWLFDVLSAKGGIHSGVGAVQSLILGLLCALLLVYLRWKDRLAAKDIQSGAVCLLVGGFLGVLSAFLGIGGGPLNLAILTYFFSMDNKKAALHSLYVVLFSQCASLALTIFRGLVPPFSVSLLLCVCVAGILGALIGSAIVRRIDGQTVGRLYGAVLIFVLGISVYNLLHY